MGWYGMVWCNAVGQFNGIPSMAMSGPSERSSLDAEESQRIFWGAMKLLLVMVLVGYLLQYHLSTPEKWSRQCTIILLYLILLSRSCNRSTRSAPSYILPYRTHYRTFCNNRLWLLKPLCRWLLLTESEAIKSLTKKAAGGFWLFK